MGVGVEDGNKENKWLHRINLEYFDTAKWYGNGCILWTFEIFLQICTSSMENCVISEYIHVKS